MTDKEKKAIKKLCREYPEDVVRQLLEQPFWLPSLSPMVAYRRFDDDTPRGRISIVFSPDSDGWIDVVRFPDPEELDYTARFRVPGIGAGESSRTRLALLILALAMKLDNETHPQKREGA